MKKKQENEDLFLRYGIASEKNFLRGKNVTIECLKNNQVFNYVRYFCNDFYQLFEVVISFAFLRGIYDQIIIKCNQLCDNYLILKNEGLLVNFLLCLCVSVITLEWLLFQKVLPIILQRKTRFFRLGRKLYLFPTAILINIKKPI